MMNSIHTLLGHCDVLPGVLLRSPVTSKNIIYRTCACASDHGVLEHRATQLAITVASLMAAWQAPEALPPPWASDHAGLRVNGLSWPDG